MAYYFIGLASVKQRLEWSRQKKFKIAVVMFQRSIQILLKQLM